MDIKEFDTLMPLNRRHFWEQAKTTFFGNILKRYVPNATKVGDVGCGDGVTLEKLVELYPKSLICGFDPELSDELAAQINARFSAANIQVSSDPKEFVTSGKYDLILMLDVIEHIPDAEKFLLESKQNLSSGGSLLVSVPAYQALYSGHDRWLGHVKRYQRKELVTLLQNSGFEIQESGYLFFSLLLPRLIQKIFFDSKDDSKRKNLNETNNVFNKLALKVLLADVQLGLLCRKLKIQLPGLSCFAICRKL